MIRALIFDCFGVFYSDDIQKTYDIIATEHLDEAHRLVREVDRGLLTVDEYVDAMATLSGRTQEVIRNIIATPHVRNDELIKRLKELKSTYKIGLLSNVNTEALDRIFPRADRDALFDAQVLSSEVGMLKPDPEIYQLIAVQLGVPVKECIFSDDKVSNIEGARRAGMQGIVFSDNHQWETDLKKILESSHA